MDGEFFECTKLDAKLTREACGKRHLRTKRRAYPGTQLNTDMYGVFCGACVIGKLHASGDMPDVRVTMLVQRGRAA